MANRYGWCPDIPDIRDVKYSAPAPTVPLPPKIDLRPYAAAVRDQQDCGSCTANCIAAAIDFELLKQNKPILNPSRLFIYYLERELEGTIRSDSGAQIRDGIKSVTRYGVAPESMWPYDVSKFMIHPPSACYAVAEQNVITKYTRIMMTLNTMKTCLSSGYPFVFGFTVYDAFESDEVARTGIVTMPLSGETPVGGHAVLCVGYDDTTKRFMVQNSWGTHWGQAGFFEIPYNYLTNVDLADDAWSIRL